MIFLVMDIHEASMAGEHICRQNKLVICRGYGISEFKYFPLKFLVNLRSLTVTFGFVVFIDLNL